MSVDYSNNSPSAIQTRLDQLDPTTDYAEISDAVKQLQTRVNSNPATTLQINNDSLNTVQNQIVQAKEELQIAKERAAGESNSRASYYESWFPLNRPLRKPTILILLVIGIFFFSLAFFMLLHSLGFLLHMNITWYNPQTISKLKTLFPFPLNVISILLVILTIIGWLRTG